MPQRTKNTYLSLQLVYIMIMQAVFTSCATFFEFKGMALNEALLLTAKIGICFNFSIAAISLLKNKTSLSQQGCLIVGFLLISVGLMLLSIMDNILFLSLGGIIIAMGSALTKPVVTVLFGKTIAKAENERAFKVFYAITNIGALLGPLLFGILTLDTYHFGFMALSTVALAASLYQLGIQNNFFFVKRHYLFMLAIFTSLSFYIFDHMIIGILIFIMSCGLKFSYKKIANRFKKINKQPLIHVFLIFTLIDQKYFLIQKIFIENLQSPFNTPLLYAFSALIVVVSLFLQLKTQWLKMNHKQTIIASYCLCMVGYSLLFMALKNDIFLLEAIFISLTCFSVAEILCIPQALKEMATESTDKVLGVVSFLLTISFSLFISSYLNSLCNEYMLILSSIITCLIIICVYSFCVTKKKEKTI